MASLTDNALLRSIAKSIGAAPGDGGGDTTIVDLVTSKIDPLNSTSTPLAAGASFVGQWVDVSGYSSITIAVAADVAAAAWGLKFEWSLTGSGAAIASNSYYNNSPFYRSVSRNVAYPYFRVRYINGGTNQATFNLTSILQRLPIVNVDVASSGEADTELTAPLTLSDAIANPTVPLIGSANLYWSGAGWSRSAAYRDPLNSTSTPLGANQTFTGQWFDAYRFNSIQVSYHSDVTGTLQIQYSEDGVNTMTPIGYGSASRRSLATSKVYRFCRIIYINGATPQTFFNLNTVFDPTRLTSVSVTSASDTELTPPQTLADNLSNFTVPIVGAAGLYWTGSAWARSRLDTKLDSLISLLATSRDSSISVASPPITGASTFVGLPYDVPGSTRRLAYRGISWGLSEDPAAPILVTVRATYDGGGANIARFYITTKGAGFIPAFNWLDLLGCGLSVEVTTPSPATLYVNPAYSIL